jgi:SAM-dependent methyltransferase
VTGVVQALLRRYARGEAAAVAPWIVGRRVLDVGAGEAYVAAALRECAAASVLSADVGLFARAPGPYVVCDGGRLPLADGAVDTTLLLFTLHHCADPERVLDEALRVTRRRLLVLESVYRNRRDRFWLDLLDGRVNRFRHGGRMAPALAVRPAPGWLELFRARGLDVRAMQWLGSRLERLIHQPLLFVLDVPSAPGDRPGEDGRGTAGVDGARAPARPAAGTRA